MAQSYFQDPPQAQGNWEVNLSKMAVLFWQWMNGEIVPPSTQGGVTIPANNQQEFAYYGSTNNIQTITYKNGGATVAVQTFTYIAGGAADDDLIATITLT